VRWRRSQADIGCRCPFFRAVPELTRSADIQLNNRLSLRRHREMLSQPQIVGGKLMDSAQGCGNQAAECIRLKKSAPTRIKPGFSEISLLVGQELQAKSTDTMSLCGNGAALTERSGRRCHVRTDNYQAQPDEMGMASVRQQGECPKAGVRKKSQGRQVQRRARAVSSIGRAGTALTTKGRR
jgi:hypothetical protein